MMTRSMIRKLLITFVVFICGVFLLSLGAVGTKKLTLKESKTSLIPQSEFCFHPTGNYEKYKKCTDKCYSEWMRCVFEAQRKYKECIRNCKGDKRCENYCYLSLSKKAQECDRQSQECYKRCEKYL